MPWQKTSSKLIMKKNILLLLLSTLSINWLSAANTPVYIASAETGIYLSHLDGQTGSLSKPELVSNIGGAGFLAKHPTHPYLYATGHIEKGVGCVAAYKIHSDGKLVEIGKQAAKGKKLCHVSLDATSKVLMVANYSEGNVVSFPLNQDGTIGKVASFHKHVGSSVHPTRQNQPHAHSIYSGPSNKFAYAPDLGIDKIMIYAIEPDTAKLTHIGFSQSPAGSGPRHMKFGKNGKQAYVLNELTLSISVFDQNPVSGKLTPKQLVSTLPEGADKTAMSCSEIRVSKDGKFIYCANRNLTETGRDSISVFSVGGGGKIARIQTIGAEVWIPRNINLDPSGKWLLVAGQKSNNVPVFKVDKTTGMLSYTGNKIEIPKAMCIEFK